MAAQSHLSGCTLYVYNSLPVLKHAEGVICIEIAEGEMQCQSPFLWVGVAQVKVL